LRGTGYAIKGVLAEKGRSDALACACAVACRAGPQRASRSALNCWHCGREIDTRERVGFRDTCSGCDRPVHVCRNCDFYDPAYHNQCREPSAESVVDKDRANFCEYFAPARASRPVGSGAARAAVQNKLDSLFRKKP